MKLAPGQEQIFKLVKPFWNFLRHLALLMVYVAATIHYMSVIKMHLKNSEAYYGVDTDKIQVQKLIRGFHQ